MICHAIFCLLCTQAYLQNGVAFPTELEGESDKTGVLEEVPSEEAMLHIMGLKQPDREPDQSKNHNDGLVPRLQEGEEDENVDAEDYLHWLLKMTKDGLDVDLNKRGGVRPRSTYRDTPDYGDFAYPVRAVPFLFKKRSGRDAKYSALTDPMGFLFKRDDQRKREQDAERAYVPTLFRRDRGVPFLFRRDSSDAINRLIDEVVKGRQASQLQPTSRSVDFLFKKNVY